MRPLLLSIMLSFISISLFAQDRYLNDVAETQELSKKVAALFAENNIVESLNLIRPYQFIPLDKIEYIEGQSGKLSALIKDNFGDAIGALKVKNETISDIALRETYLVRYVNSAIRLVFTYYKNDKGWIVNDFKWDDSFTNEFK